MQTRILGGSGLAVSELGQGCNNFGGMIASLDAAASIRVIHASLDAGMKLLCSGRFRMFTRPDQFIRSRSGRKRDGTSATFRFIWKPMASIRGRSFQATSPGSR